MSGTAEREQAGWRALVWRAYEGLPRSADGLLRLATVLALPAINRAVPLALLRGATADGGSASVLTAGTSRFADELARAAFREPPTATALGTVPIWRLRREIARRRADVDLVVVRLDRVSAALALGSGYVAVPEWVGASAPVPEDLGRFCARSKSLHANAARARRAGFRMVVSHDLADFDHFYERMYVPYLRRRHGAAAMVSNRARLRRCLRQGALLFADRDGTRVAGALVRRRGAMLDLVVIGTAGGELDALASGAVFALDVFVLEYARTLGCGRLDFGGSRPSPLDGLLVYKARWGAQVIDSRTTFYDVHLWWSRLGPAVLDLLTRMPVIVREPDGLAAVWARPSSARRLREGRSVLRGLRRLHVIDATPEILMEARAIGIPIVAVERGTASRGIRGPQAGGAPT